MELDLRFNRAAQNLDSEKDNFTENADQIIVGAQGLSGNLVFHVIIAPDMLVRAMHGISLRWMTVTIMLTLHGMIPAAEPMIISIKQMRIMRENISARNFLSICLSAMGRHTGIWNRAAAGRTVSDQTRGIRPVGDCKEHDLKA